MAHLIEHYGRVYVCIACTYKTDTHINDTEVIVITILSNLSLCPNCAEEPRPCPNRSEDLSSCPNRSEDLSLCPNRAEDLSPCPSRAEDLSLCPNRAEDLSPCPNRSEDLSLCPNRAEDLSPCPNRAEDLSLCPNRAEDLSLCPNRAEKFIHKLLQLGLELGSYGNECELAPGVVGVGGPSEEQALDERVAGLLSQALQGRVKSVIVLSQELSLKQEPRHVTCV